VGVGVGVGVNCCVVGGTSGTGITTEDEDDAGGNGTLEVLAGGAGSLVVFGLGRLCGRWKNKVGSEASPSVTVTVTHSTTVVVV